MSIEGKLLYRGYVFDEDLVLDLYGEPADEDTGYMVLTATPINTLHNLAGLLSHQQLADMGHWLDRREFFDDMEGAIACAEQDRQMRQNDNQWRQF